MEASFIIICITIIIVQIHSIIQFKNTGDSKYWNTFAGVMVANFIFSIFSYIFILFEGTFAQAIAYLLVLALSCSVNILLLIIGFLIKKNIKNHNIKLNKNSIRIGLLFLFLSIIITIIPSTIGYEISNAEIKKNTILYLNNKYGDNSFRIVEIKKHYSYEGIIDKYHSGYEAIVSSSLLKDNFTVYLYGKDPFKTEKISEKFIENYYKEKVNKYLSNRYDAEFDIKINEEKIPNIPNRIPTFDELINYGAIDKLYINYKNNEPVIYDRDIVVRTIFLKELSLYITKYLNISKDIDVTFTRYYKNMNWWCEIHISNNNANVVSCTDKQLRSFK